MLVACGLFPEDAGPLQCSEPAQVISKRHKQKPRTPHRQRPGVETTERRKSTDQSPPPPLSRDPMVVLMFYRAVLVKPRCSPALLASQWTWEQRA